MDPRPDKDNVRARLGANVRDLRMRRRMTQNDLSERSGLSMKFIGEVERGISNPSIVSVAAIARALDADVADLFGGTARPVDHYAATRRQLAVVRENADRLVTSLKEMQAAAAGRLRRKRRKTKD
jgi:transcriptional regulator with XRE-family HTH domain